MNWSQLITFAYGGKVENDLGEGSLPYYTNPTKSELKSLVNLQKRKDPYFPHLRAVADYKTGKLHAYPAIGPLHEDFLKQTGIHVEHPQFLYLHSYDPEGELESASSENKLMLANHDTIPKHPHLSKLGFDKSNEIDMGDN